MPGDDAGEGNLKVNNSACSCGGVFAWEASDLPGSKGVRTLPGQAVEVGDAGGHDGPHARRFVLRGRFLRVRGDGRRRRGRGSSMEEVGRGIAARTPTTQPGVSDVLCLRCAPPAAFRRRPVPCPAGGRLLCLFCFVRFWRAGSARSTQVGKGHGCFCLCLSEFSESGSFCLLLLPPHCQVARCAPATDAHDQAGQCRDHVSEQQQEEEQQQQTGEAQTRADQCLKDQQEGTGQHAQSQQAVDSAPLVPPGGQQAPGALRVGAIEISKCVLECLKPVFLGERKTGPVQCTAAGGTDHMVLLRPASAFWTLNAQWFPTKAAEGISCVCLTTAHGTGKSKNAEGRWQRLLLCLRHGRSPSLP